MRQTWDWILLSQILAIGSISVLIISSINSSLAINQIFFWLIGIAVLLIVSRLNYSRWLSLSIPLYLVTILFLIMLLLFGDPIRGSTRWIDFGFFRFQPSELAKAVSILILATFYSSRTAVNLRNIIISIFIIIPVVIFVVLQPDIGNTFAIFTIWLAIVLVAGVKIKYIASLALIFSFLLIIFIQFLAPYQKERLESFFQPLSDPLGTGYNQIQSEIAIGSGQLLGKGYGQGSQSQLQFLPESESDFIFASVSEQLGLVGSSLLLILFTWMIVKIISYTKNTDKFGQLIIAGTVAYFTTQFVVNVGMNIGILPITGLTFPLVSYGGSSLLTNLFILGIIFSIIRKGH